jgi:hypothetical protein
MSNRRDFFKKATGALAAVAITRQLPVAPEPVVPDAPLLPTPAPAPPVETITMCVGDEVTTFKVFGRETTYSIPGTRNHCHRCGRVHFPYPDCG